MPQDDEIKALRDYVQGVLATEQITADVRVEPPSQIVNDDASSIPIPHDAVTVIVSAAVSLATSAITSVFKELVVPYVKEKIRQRKLPQKVLIVDKDGKPLVTSDDD